MDRDRNTEGYGWAFARSVVGSSADKLRLLQVFGKNLDLSGVTRIEIESGDPGAPGPPSMDWCGPMNNFLVIDHSIKRIGGHNYEYALHILRAAERQGYRPVLAVNRRFSRENDCRHRGSFMRRFDTRRMKPPGSRRNNGSSTPTAC